MHLRRATQRDLPELTQLLAASCPFDQASAVTEEKLFGPSSSWVTYDVWSQVAVAHDGRIAGVVSLQGNRIRLLAVSPEFRNHGIGSALLRECEQVAKRYPRVWALGQAGNYLAPGIDSRNQPTIEWLRKRGWSTIEEVRTNLLVKARDNPRVAPERLADLSEAARAQGYTIRRAHSDETAFLLAVQREFGGAWPFELARALRWRSDDEPHRIGGVHIATYGDSYAAFAAHNGNNFGLGWFGPAGTWPAHRGKKLGETLLVACLLDVALEQEVCEVAWIGPEQFYEKSVGVAGRRQFVVMKKEW